ncbi:MAG TPA: DNA primase [Gaiellaceae bacterium]|nr:DNA primase [Gaiellaceae bacterium]
MARIKPESVEAVKAAADMLDVVGARTQLRKVGARHTGRCPFHEERTPSFSVNAVDKLYYCFGCGAGGDLISFVKETENLDFSGAVEWLADRFRVELEYEETSPRVEAERRRRDRIGELLAAATAFYERNLWDSGGAADAREYLAGRGLGEEICRTFRLGFAPGGRTLAQKAAERGFTTDELLAAGLVNRRGNDYFSQRIVFPLADARGRVLGFQARRLREDDPLQAKYVNSPESDVFQKGSILYGLDLARTTIAKQDRAVVVEGNTDVIALRQEGLDPVVASMGTALTGNHVRQLSRLTHNLWLCFDGDAAGEAATLRGMELAAAEGLVIKVIALPADQDPADLAAGFERRLADADPYLVHRVRIEIDRAADRQDAFLRVREVLSKAEDSPERQDAVRLAADRLDLPSDLQAGLASRTRAATGSVSPKVLQAGDRLERDALAGCLAHPQLVASLAELEPEAFDSEQHRALRAHLIQGGELPGVLVALVAELDARAVAEQIDERTSKELLLRLTERDLRRQLARTNGDLSKTLELQEKLERVRKALDALS